MSVDRFDKYRVARFSVFKPLIFSTMHAHLHLLQWLSSSITTEEEITFILGYIYTKIRVGANGFQSSGDAKPTRLVVQQEPLQREGV